MDSGAANYLDIIIYAVISCILFFALFNVLGKDVGHKDEELGKGFFDEPEDITARTQAASQPVHIDHYGDPRIEAGTRAILALDDTFDMGHFLQGAGSAYAMITEAAASGDVDTLKHLLSPQIYGFFEADIHDRALRGERAEARVEKIKSATPQSVDVKGTVATIVIVFDAEHTSVLYNKGGEVIAGDPDLYAHVRDTFTFERDLRGSEGLWRVVATQSE